MIVCGKGLHHDKDRKLRLNASGVVSERGEGPVTTVSYSTMVERGRPMVDVVWWCSVVAANVAGGYERLTSVQSQNQTYALRLQSALLPLTQLPNERGQRGAIEDGKRLHKQLLRKEAGALASIDLRPRGTNLANERRSH